jgi:hypothetical protein
MQIESKNKAAKFLNIYYGNIDSEKVPNDLKGVLIF